MLYDRPRVPRVGACTNLGAVRKLSTAMSLGFVVDQSPLIEARAEPRKVSLKRVAAKRVEAADVPIIAEDLEAAPVARWHRLSPHQGLVGARGAVGREPRLLRSRSSHGQEG